MHYRLYLMNPASGHIDGLEEFDCADDASAFNHSFGFAGDRPVELWCESRKIGRIEGRDLTQEMLERRRWERALRDAKPLAAHSPTA